jgi:phosphatidylglycerophosphate synthase
MLTLSNVLSFSRAGFALAFLQENNLIRLIAVVLAMITDFLDGFIARRSKSTSQFGAILDPVMDKFFVFFAAGILYIEGALALWQFIALVSRDLSLCIFGLYLLLVRGWKEYECRGIFWGKIITSGQFLLLIGLSLNLKFNSFVYGAFFVMAFFAFLELCTRHRKKSSSY